MTDPQLQMRLEALSGAPFNLDLEQQATWHAKDGWNHDRYQTELVAEPPGPPLSNGSFQAACQVLREYRFPPPDLITGIFLPDQPLEQRVMLLRGQFVGMVFYFGVKVSGVVSELRQTPHGAEHVWGYRYATLEGHFERGQIEFLIAKHVQSGKVEFRISAVSRTGVIQNMFYRIGFQLFGRRLQRRFATESLKRMQRLVKIAVETGEHLGTTPQVQAATSDPTAETKMQELQP